MAADERPAQPLAEAIGFGFQTIIEGLRADVREDFRELRLELAQSELRMTERVAALGADWRTFTVGHGREHESLSVERREAHGAFYQFIKDAELDDARRDGALGVVRFIIEKLGANAPRLIALIVTIAAAVATITGNVHFVVGR